MSSGPDESGYREERVRSLNVFFDVDYTMQGVDGSLRPGTREVFERLVAEGHSVYVWSGVGMRTADVERHELSHLVTAVYEKPLRDFEEGLRERNIDARPDFVVDDYPEIVSVFGGTVIRPYYFASTLDQEMERVYQTIREFAATPTHRGDPAFKDRNGYTPSSE